MTFSVRIEETVSEVFSVEAEDESEAVRIAEDNYKNERFVLEPGNLTDVQFSIG